MSIFALAGQSFLTHVILCAQAIKTIADSSDAMAAKHHCACWPDIMTGRFSGLGITLSATRSVANSINYVFRIIYRIREKPDNWMH
ncbi:MULTISPECIES: hypothetical protein [Burkholderia]|uniref:hypothetical protein n=1 Tax=Burkholderia TaxID=32008 RepID=UPI00158D7CFB|nr:MULTISPECIES: hypothetical protein [Burkholderia]